MKTKVLLSLLAAISASIAFFAHTQNVVNLGEGPWTSYGAGFTLNNTQYFSLLVQSNILATMRWEPSRPLPISMDKAVKIARGELQKLVPDDREWKLTSIELESLALRAPSADDAWFFRVRFEPTGHARLNGPNPQPYVDKVEVAVDFAGRPGKIETYQEFLRR
jgi:hypothetical protein